STASCNQVTPTRCFASNLWSWSYCSTLKDVNGRPIDGSGTDKLLDDIHCFGHFI
ncbi:unnamed protein product, partial [Larinioides sclopetarius]